MQQEVHSLWKKVGGIRQADKETKESRKRRGEEWGNRGREGRRCGGCWGREEGRSGGVNERNVV